MDSAYFDVFDYAMPGDTISFRNVSHKTYLDMELNKHNVRKINGVRESEIVKIAQRSALQKQK